MKTVGRHLIAELYSCDRDLLDDIVAIREAMLKAAAVIGATVKGEVFQRFEPRGVSGTVVIAESHLSIHTWPENGYVAVDIFTCGGLDPRPGVRLVGELLRASSLRLQEIVRGLSEHVEGVALLLPDDVRIITRTSPVVDLNVST